MAWSTSSSYGLQMAEDDYGIALPFTVTGVTIGDDESLLFTFKDKMNGTTILEKEFTDIEDNTVSLVFTEDESALFSVGSYVYSLDWYSDGEFLCNIIRTAPFKVVDKA